MNVTLAFAVLATLFSIVSVLLSPLIVLPETEFFWRIAYLVNLIGCPIFAWSAWRDWMRGY